jgi:hypothetical protein
MLWRANAGSASQGILKECRKRRQENKGLILRPIVRRVPWTSVSAALHAPGLLAAIS